MPRWLASLSVPVFLCVLAAAALASDRQVILRHADSRVGTYVSKPWGFSTSSYWIEGPSGLVLIDAQFLPSAATEAVEWAEHATGKKVVLAILTHANPDKFNGTEVLQKRGIRVVTSRQVADLLPKVHALRSSWFAERYAPDYPTNLPRPEVFGDHTLPLDVAGLHLTLHVLGPGCSEAHVVVQWEDHVFPGDLVANNTHAWLEIGRPDQWLLRLFEIRAMAPQFVHPGRGPSAGPELLDAQEAYLRQVVALVHASHPKLPVSDALVDKLKARLVALYPAYDFAVFLGLGLPAEIERQARLPHGARLLPNRPEAKRN